MRHDQWSKSSILDIGVTKYVQRVPSYFPTSPGMGRGDLLRHKVLIMVEGNDAATGLKWALLSKSAVVMPRPKVATWLMEDLLVPGVHYLEVRPDFSDLEEVVRWCFDNDDECRRVAEAGTCWMARFLDAEQEARVMEEVWRGATERMRIQGTCDG